MNIGGAEGVVVQVWAGPGGAAERDISGYCMSVCSLIHRSQLFRPILDPHCEDILSGPQFF